MAQKFIKRLINQQKWKDKEKQGTDSLACKDSLRWGDAQKDRRVQNHWYFFNVSILELQVYKKISMLALQVYKS